MIPNNHKKVNYYWGCNEKLTTQLVPVSAPSLRSGTKTQCYSHSKGPLFALKGVCANARIHVLASDKGTPQTFADETRQPT